MDEEYYSNLLVFFVVLGFDSLDDDGSLFLFRATITKVNFCILFLECFAVKLHHGVWGRVADGEMFRL